MLTFLRKIRKSLIGTGSGRYLLYAIGEIALVVIGILIALQINNWNEQRKDQIKEVSILKSLIEEFESNLQHIDEIISRQRSSLDSMTKLLSLTGEKVELRENQNLNKMIKTATIPFSFNFEDGTLNATLNSGNIELIKNQELKRMLSGCHGIVEDAKEESEVVWKLLEEQLSPIMSIYYLDYYPPVTFPSNLEGMLSDRSFHNTLKRIRNWTAAGIVDLEKVKEHFVRIIEITSNELGN